MIGKATDEDPKRPLAEISAAFADNAPLWAYVLSEAHTTSLASAPPSGDPNAVPIRLGPVGGRLVAEVFGALLDGDPGSLPHARPRFAPQPQLTRDGRFGLAELINAALS